jgi:hypothetical protein
LSDIDPTDHALATIASILEQPEHPREAVSPLAEADHRDDDEHPLVEEQPLAPDFSDHDGYSRVGPGPMEALRFKWTAQLGDDGQYYVHETIGEHSTPVVNGPMSRDAAVQLVDERASEAHHRFEELRSEIAGRSAAAELVHRGEA